MICFVKHSGHGGICSREIPGLMTVGSIGFLPQAMYPTIPSLHSGCNMIESETDHLIRAREKAWTTASQTSQRSAISFFGVLTRLWVATSRLQSPSDALMEIGRMLFSSVKCVETRRRAELTNCGWCLGKSLLLPRTTVHYRPSAPTWIVCFCLCFSCVIQRADGRSYCSIFIQLFFFHGSM